MRQLLLAAVDMPAQYDREGRDGALARLLLHEVDRAPALPPHPARARGWGVVPGFMAAPDIRSRPQDWAGRLHMSPRSFSRHFREHTGMSYAQWRQRACVVLALARLAAGDPVTVIALDFGYQGPAAFSTMFRRVLGAAPPPTCAPTRTLHSTQEVLLQRMPRSRLCRSAGMPLGASALRGSSSVRWHAPGSA